MKKRVKNLFFSLLLTVALLLPISTPVYAEENTNKEVVDAAIIFADLHTNQNDYKDEHIQSIMKGLKSTELPFSSVISGGDAFSVCDDDHDRFPKDLGITSKITQSIRTGLGNDSIPVEYVWSDHDRYADIFFSESDSEADLYQKRTSRFVYGVNDNNANYYVYALSMADTTDNDRYNVTPRTTEQIKAVIKDFEATVATLDKNKPLFIVAHQPLFYNRKDNDHAYLWYESIQKIAETMDVAYFFGHNHKYDNTQDYYQAEGTMYVATPNDGNKPYSNLNFTHICAGYMEPTSTDSYSDTTRRSTAIGITIYEDSIRYATYDAGGLYTGKYNLDVTLERKFASSQESNNTTLSVERLSLENNREYYLAVSNVLNNYTGYDIHIPSDAKNTGISVSLPRPLPGSEVPLAVYRVAADAQTSTRIKTSLTENGNALSFTTDSDGIYFIGTDLTGATPGTSFAAGVAHPQEESVYYVPATSFENGCNYLLIGEKGIGGDKIAYLNNNGNEGYETVSITDSKISCDNNYAVWTASGNDTDGYVLSNNGRYIGGETGNTVKGSSGEAARLMYTNSDVRLHTKANSPLYLYYSTSGSEQWKFINSKDSSTSSRQMWIYKEVIETVPTTDYCEHAFASETTEGNCTSVGYTINTCVLCGYSNFGNFTPKLDNNHDYVITTTDNSSSYTCKGCEHSYTTTKEKEQITTSAGPKNAPAEKKTTYEEKTIYVPVDSFENNGKYLLIGEESIGGTPLAHLNKNGDEGAQKVTINTTPLVTDTATYKDGYIELSNANAVWTAFGDASKGFVLSNNGKYIGTKSDNDGDTIRSSSSNATKVIYDASADRLKTASGTTKYLYYTTYSGEYWKWATSANSSTSSRNMRIYKEVTVKVAK